MNAAGVVMTVFSTQQLTDLPAFLQGPLSQDYLGPHTTDSEYPGRGGQASQPEFLSSAPCDPAPTPEVSELLPEEAEEWHQPHCFPPTLYPGEIRVWGR